MQPDPLDPHGEDPRDSSWTEPIFVPMRRVTACEPDSMSVAECLAALRANEQAKAFLDSENVRLLARVHRDPEPAGMRLKDLAKARQYQVDEVAAVLSWSPSAAVSRTLAAETIVAHLPQTHDALTHARIDLDKASVIARVAQTLPRRDKTRYTELVATLEARVLRRAGRQTVSELRRSARLCAARLDPRGDRERRRDAEDSRCIQLIPDENGMAVLRAHGPAEDVQLIDTAIQAVADTAPAGDTRTQDQRRFDALTEICARSLTGGTGTRSDNHPTWQGREPRTEVVVALSTLLGLDEQPGILAGHGPIPADVARRVAADPTGTWRRLVTDRLGHVIDCGRAKYRPPQDLTDFIIARDRTSRGLGRSTLARRSDLDHTTRWADGGPTDAANLRALDQRSHQQKDNPASGWRLLGTNPDGDTEWVLPHGEIKTKPADELPEDHTLTVSTMDPPPY